MISSQPISLIFIFSLFIYSTSSTNNNNFFKFNHFREHQFPGQADQVIGDLPGLPASLTELPFRHYAGYLNALNGTRLFYWFFESLTEKRELALFLNGGPGCSSLVSSVEFVDFFG